MLVEHFSLYLISITKLKPSAHRYTFGNNVQGTVKINATLEAAGRRESLSFYKVVNELVSCERYSISKYYDNIVPYYEFIYYLVFHTSLN